MEQGRDLTAEGTRTGLLFCEQPHLGRTHRPLLKCALRCSEAARDAVSAPTGGRLLKGRPGFAGGFRCWAVRFGLSIDRQARRRRNGHAKQQAGCSSASCGDDESRRPDAKVTNACAEVTCPREPAKSYMGNKP